MTERSPPASSVEHALAAGGDGLADVAFDGGAAGQGLEAAVVAAAALRAAELHDHVADFAGRLAIAAPQLAALHESAADARADADVQRALGLAGRAEPGFAQRAEVAVVADDDGRLEAGLQQRAEVDARQSHVRRHDHQPAVGIDHAGHGDADGRQVVGRDAALADHVVHALFDGGDDAFRAALARRGALLAADDLARLAHQRGLHLRAADVHAQVQPRSPFDRVCRSS